MITEKQKLDNFHCAIDHYALEQRKKIEEEISNLKETLTKEAENTVLSEAFSMIQTEMTDMRQKITSEMAAREVAAKKELLKKRMQITEHIFSLAKEKLVQFTKSEDYLLFLKKKAKSVSKALPNNNTTIYMKKEDFPYFDCIEKTLDCPCCLLEDNSILIGGFYAENQEAGLFIDATIDTLLQQQVTWFEENSGLSVL